MAPETIEGGDFDSQADMWSLGVLLYIMMSGYLPFQGKTTPLIFEKIQKGAFHFNHKEFKLVSDESKDLISKLLVVDPSKRLSANQVLEHAWFVKFSGFDESKVKIEQLDLNVLARLKQYRGVSQLKHACMNILVKMATDEELKELKKAFKAIDLDGTGLIKAHELKEIIQ